MLDNQGFDLWADGYDEAVGLSDEGNEYPFAGYKAVLDRIFNIIMEKPAVAVLDLGFGTGTLTARLYENGCEIFGQDFSVRMVETAFEKMPEAHLYRGDFSQGLAEPLRSRKYDFIVATYSLHHLTDEQKKSFIDDLLGYLEPGGKILIGDVAFENRIGLERCRKQSGEEWDDDEIYFVIDEMKAVYPGLVFEPKSFCAGVVILSHE